MQFYYNIIAQFSCNGLEEDAASLLRAKYGEEVRSPFLVENIAIKGKHMQLTSRENLRFVGLALAATLFVGLSASSAFASSGKTVPPPPPVVTTTITALVVPSGVVLPSITALGAGPFTETFALINTGTIPLVINTVALSVASADYHMSGAGAGLCSSGMIVPTGTGTAAVPTGANVCTVTVTYMPSAIGLSASPQVNFVFANSAAQSGALPLTNVLSADPVLVAQALNVLSFADTPVATMSAPRAFQIRNAGGAPLVISSVTVTGDSADFFPTFFPQITRSVPLPTCTAFGNPITLNTFGGCGFIYAFTPKAEGARSATVTLTTNDPLNPTVLFTLSGNGLPALPPPVPVAAFNVTDEWTSPTMTSLVLSIIHHAKTSLATNSDGVVATIDTLDASNAAVWYVIKNGAWTSTTSYTGDVKDSAGVLVGSGTLSFTGANSGTLTYTVNGVTNSVAIARAGF